MKKIVFFLTAAFFSCSTQAQYKSDTLNPAKILGSTVPVAEIKKTTVKPVNKMNSQTVPPHSTNTIPTTNTNTTTQASSSNTNSYYAYIKRDSCTFPNLNAGTGTTTCYTDYYLTGLSIKFYTGMDNKEYPSTVDIMAHLPFGSSYSGDPNAPVFLYSNQESGESDRKQEFKSNGTNHIKLKTPYVLYNGANSEHQPNNLRLAKLLNSGLIIKITYFPNLLTDAWKINKIEVIPEVKKPDGTLHPLYNNKIITFNHAKLLTSGSGTKNSYVLRIDNTMNAGVAY
ncbi:MAG: hypothetical protein EOP53_02905 [Sphingobacteriales bacterium]|nr:MAG: hypothetical protein EOP53_02905 [Sphingobacteriales bacterium]